MSYLQFSKKVFTTLLLSVFILNGFHHQSLHFSCQRTQIFIVDKIVQIMINYTPGYTTLIVNTYRSRCCRLGVWVQNHDLYYLHCGAEWLLDTIDKQLPLGCHHPSFCSAFCVNFNHTYSHQSLMSLFFFCDGQFIFMI